MKLTLEEILTLGIIVHAQSQNAKIEQIEAARHSRRYDNDWFYSEELQILQSNISWMYNAKTQYDKLDGKTGPYANLTLAEYIAQSRPEQSTKPAVGPPALSGSWGDHIEACLRELHELRKLNLK